MRGAARNHRYNILRMYMYIIYEREKDERKSILVKFEQMHVANGNGTRSYKETIDN